jgi:hypothetical protein
MAEQTVPVDLMIKRLEEANARAHEKISRADEQVRASEQDAARHSSDRYDQPAAACRRSSPGGLVLGLVGSLAATSFGVLAFVSQSPEGEAAMRVVARWTSSMVQTTRQDLAPTADLLSAELTQRLQAMAGDLASVAAGIEQLKSSQQQMRHDNAEAAEQFKAALSRLTRDNAAAAEQFKTALTQITQAAAAIAEQLRTSQEQAVRPRAGRRPVSILPQIEPQSEVLIRR